MMFNRFVAGTLVALSVVMLPSVAGAATIIDRSPSVIGGPLGFTAVNQASDQNFLVQFTLASAVTLDAGAIYSDYGNSAVGSSVIVKFRNDVSGSPDTSNLYEISTTLAAVDTDGNAGLPNMQRLAANFAPIAFAAGTYWFGLSGDGYEPAWSLDVLARTGADGVWQLDQNNLQFSFNNTTAAPFALYGTAANNIVPEPASWTMLIVGFGLTGAAMRRRVRVVA